ncbi:MAG TPA: carboxymuconolactone decarboxylase family protein [Streptomyces sp.]|nr:carboxymuconolactone decarboxylase family protein [Streptomyces sp.]
MTTDSARINVWKAAPDLYQGMAAFQRAAADGLDPEIGELIKIRCSQINKCAFCLDMHNTDARKMGIDQLKLDLLPAWEEADGLYSPRERAALALAEAVTLLTDGFVPDEVYAEAAKQFEEAELARLIAQIVAINSWNRFQVTIRRTPASLARQQG